MFESQYQFAGYSSVDQYAVSQRAARQFAQFQAVRERKAQRKAERQQRRADRHSQASYTTAV